MFFTGGFTPSLQNITYASLKLMMQLSYNKSSFVKAIIVFYLAQNRQNNRNICQYNTIKRPNLQTVFSKMTKQFNLETFIFLT